MYYPIPTILQNINKWTFTCWHQIWVAKSRLTGQNGSSGHKMVAKLPPKWISLKLKIAVDGAKLKVGREIGAKHRREGEHTRSRKTRAGAQHHGRTDPRAHKIGATLPQIKSPNSRLNWWFLHWIVSTTSELGFRSAKSPIGSKFGPQTIFPLQFQFPGWAKSPDFQNCLARARGAIDAAPNAYKWKHTTFQSVLFRKLKSNLKVAKPIRQSSRCLVFVALTFWDVSFDLKNSRNRVQAVS